MSNLVVLPKDYNWSLEQGRSARASGLPMVHRYGESAGGKDWEQGWKAENLISTVPITAPAAKATAMVVTDSESNAVVEVVRAAKPMITVGTGRRGRPPATGIFSTRAELEQAVKMRSDKDPRDIAAAVGVSIPTVLKILAGDA